MMARTTTRRTPRRVNHFHVGECDYHVVVMAKPNARGGRDRPDLLCYSTDKVEKRCDREMTQNVRTND